MTNGTSYTLHGHGAVCRFKTIFGADRPATVGQPRRDRFSRGTAGIPYEFANHLAYNRSVRFGSGPGNGDLASLTPGPSRRLTKEKHREAKRSKKPTCANGRRRSAYTTNDVSRGVRRLSSKFHWNYKKKNVKNSKIYTISSHFILKNVHSLI